MAFGADTPVGEGGAGAAVNIGTQRAKLDGGVGKVTADRVSVAAYARYSAGAFEIDGMAGVGRNSNESSRTVDVGGVVRTARRVRKQPAVRLRRNGREGLARGAGPGAGLHATA